VRRVTVVGVGGISRERASFSIRDVHSSQYGRICTVRSPEGPNIGLVTYLALYSQINKYGFLEAPLRKVVKDSKGYKISDDYIYLDVDDEYQSYVTHLGVNINKDGYIKQDWLPYRHLGEFIEGPLSLVNYTDLVPREIVGTSTKQISYNLNYIWREKNATKITSEQFKELQKIKEWGNKWNRQQREKQERI